MANPFKEAELRKQEEAKRLAEEAKKREAEAKAQTEAEVQVEAEKETESAAKQEEVKTPVAQEAAPVVTAAPEAPKAEDKDLATTVREQIDADMDKMERKVPVNVMVPPSLKRKMEQDVRNKKFKSMSYLITALLKEYYK